MICDSDDIDVEGVGMRAYSTNTSRRRWMILILSFKKSEQSPNAKVARSPFRALQGKESQGHIGTIRLHRLEA